MLGVLCVLFFSCDKEEPIPSYLYIPDFDLIVKGDRSEGSNDHDIKDAWVYVAGKFIGVFELPARVPVLEQGVQEVIIIAGIKKNGISNERVSYPFYENYSGIHQLDPSKIDTIRPQIRYRSSSIFKWVEDFEDQTISLEKSGSQSTVDSIKLISDPSIVYQFDGISEQFSAGAIIDSGYQIFEFSSSEFFDLPRGQDIYLEMNFRCSNELIIGIYPITGSVVTGVPIVNLFSTDGQWKKVYISLSEDVNVADNTGADFRVFLASQKNNSQTPEVYVDNIKLIHF